MENWAVHRIQPAEVALRDLILRHPNLAKLNAVLQELTSIEAFFECEAKVVRARQLLAVADSQSQPTAREWGDFQTPLELARKICQLLQSRGVKPEVIIEPTFGLGHFLLAASQTFPETALFYGVEIQARYEWQLKMELLRRALEGQKAPGRWQLLHEDIFAHRFAPEIWENDELLIVGNPPWVTSAELGVLESENLPVKTNLKALSGLDALTGKSNFDLGEAVLLRLAETFAGRSGTLAILCKNAVIKNWVQRLPKLPYAVEEIEALEINAQKEFGAAVAASLLVARFGAAKKSFSCRVASLEKPDQTLRRYGWHDDKFVSDLATYQTHAHFDGKSPLVWRQGLKHDCAAVMELCREGNKFRNGLGESLELEEDFLFPLFKSSDLREIAAPIPRKWVIVTQKSLQESPEELAWKAPRLWDYLSEHQSALDARKSSIYRGKPPFSIFGIGPYSFAPFKIAISGLYKTPRFSLLEPFEGQSPMLDDTTYFLGFQTRENALLAAFVLSSPPATELLAALAFSDAKRPFTKELLMRLDLDALRQATNARQFIEFWAQHGETVDARDFEAEWEIGQTRQLALMEI